jgi:hypothetical protein
MKNCARCNSQFPNFIIKNGKKINFQRRKYCLSCSPLGAHNTAQLHLPPKQGSGRDYHKMSDEQKKNHCKITYQYQKNRGLERKTKLVNSMGGCCQCCGYKNNLAALHFHHVNPKEKIFVLDVRNLTNRKWDCILQEAKKCQVLCANCHAEEHYPDLQKWGR